MIKRRLWLLVSVSLLLSACSTGTAPEASKIETLARTGNHLVIAHRGDRATKPSAWYEPEWGNSVQAIRNALNATSPSTLPANPARVEIDVRLNRSPEALQENSYGILYVHHDSVCHEINGDGTRKTYREGQQIRYVTHSVETDPPYLVDRCAERLEAVLGMRDKYGRSTAKRWVLEMKEGGNDGWMPYALYNLLEVRGQRTTEIISSLSVEMLTKIKELGLAETNPGRLTLKLMHVYKPSVANISSSEIYDDKFVYGFTHVAVSRPKISETNVAYAKDIGLQVGGWHWRFVDSETGNDWAQNMDFDFMLTDNIYDLAARPGWGW